MCLVPSRASAHLHNADSAHAWGDYAQATAGGQPATCAQASKVSAGGATTWVRAQHAAPACSTFLAAARHKADDAVDAAATAVPKHDGCDVDAAILRTHMSRASILTGATLAHASGASPCERATRCQRPVASCASLEAATKPVAGSARKRPIALVDNASSSEGASHSSEGSPEARLTARRSSQLDRTPVSSQVVATTPTTHGSPPQLQQQRLYAATSSVDERAHAHGSARQPQRKSLLAGLGRAGVPARTQPDADAMHLELRQQPLADNTKQYALLRSRSASPGLGGTSSAGRSPSQHATPVPASSPSLQPQRSAEVPTLSPPSPRSLCAPEALPLAGRIGSWDAHLAGARCGAPATLSVSLADDRARSASLRSVDNAWAQQVAFGSLQVVPDTQYAIPETQSQTQSDQRPHSQPAVEHATKIAACRTPSGSDGWQSPGRSQGADSLGQYVSEAEETAGVAAGNAATSPCQSPFSARAQRVQAHVSLKVGAQRGDAGDTGVGDVRGHELDYAPGAAGHADAQAMRSPARPHHDAALNISRTPQAQLPESHTSTVTDAPASCDVQGVRGLTPAAAQPGPGDDMPRAEACSSDKGEPLTSTTPCRASLSRPLLARRRSGARPRIMLQECSSSDEALKDDTHVPVRTVSSARHRLSAACPSAHHQGVPTAALTTPAQHSIRDDGVMGSAGVLPAPQQTGVETPDGWGWAGGATVHGQAAQQSSGAGTKLSWQRLGLPKPASALTASRSAKLPSGNLAARSISPLPLSARPRHTPETEVADAGVPRRSGLAPQALEDAVLHKAVPAHGRTAQRLKDEGASGSDQGDCSHSVEQGPRVLRGKRSKQTRASGLMVQRFAQRAKQSGGTDTEATGEDAGTSGAAASAEESSSEGEDVGDPAALLGACNLSTGARAAPADAGTQDVIEEAPVRALLLTVLTRRCMHGPQGAPCLS